jgi:hypothetical protein
MIEIYFAIIAAATNTIAIPSVYYTYYFLFSNPSFHSLETQNGSF